MSISSTIAEVFTPDRTFRRLVLDCLVSASGDIVTPIFNGMRSKKVTISVYNRGSNPLTKVALIGSTDPSLSHWREMPVDDAIWKKSANMDTLAAGADGEVWVLTAPAAYYALYVEGDGTLDVVVDEEARYAIPAA